MPQRPRPGTHPPLLHLRRRLRQPPEPHLRLAPDPRMLPILAMPSLRIPPPVLLPLIRQRRRHRPRRRLIPRHRHRRRRRRRRRRNLRIHHRRRRRRHGPGKPPPPPRRRPRPRPLHPRIRVPRIIPLLAPPLTGGIPPRLLLPVRPPPSRIPAIPMRQLPTRRDHHHPSSGLRLLSTPADALPQHRVLALPLPLATRIDDHAHARPLAFPLPAGQRARAALPVAVARVFVVPPADDGRGRGGARVRAARGGERHADVRHGGRAAAGMGVAVGVVVDVVERGGDGAAVVAGAARVGVVVREGVRVVVGVFEGDHPLFCGGVGVSRGLLSSGSSSESRRRPTWRARTGTGWRCGGCVTAGEMGRREVRRGTARAGEGRCRWFGLTMR
ncbi:hypothetical protein QBC39DRAFT_351314 [Podospora conica]|nr:hypothetical protein QBC39DRAFT_351314 [Schizothecium conicum]